MERETATLKGHRRVRLAVERDGRGMPQVFAYVGGAGGDDCKEERLLCHGWGARRVENELRSGLLTSAGLLEVPRRDWEAVVEEREDQRDRDNLSRVRLVRVTCKGDRMNVDGYTLNARVDRATWSRIAPLMRQVDTSANDVILEGDHFKGWLIEKGRENEVAALLGLSPERAFVDTRHDL